MPLDDDLAKTSSEQKKEEPKKEIEVPTNIVQFPAERVAAAYYRFADAAQYSSGSILGKFKTKNVESALDAFIPYSDFYINLRKSLDVVCSQLDDWEGAFGIIKQSEALQQKHKIPAPTKEWAVQEIERSFTEINAAKFPTEDCPYTKSQDARHMEDWGHQINTIFYQFKAETDLLQCAILGSSLLAKARQINDSFTVYFVPANSDVPVPGPKYIALVKEIRSETIGSLMEIYMCNNKISRITDQTHSR
jgi:hypothetical protein